LARVGLAGCLFHWPVIGLSGVGGSFSRDRLLSSDAIAAKAPPTKLQRD
jgi:hypothetical protein